MTEKGYLHFWPGYFHPGGSLSPDSMKTVHLLCLSMEI